MVANPHERSVLALALLQLYPPSICESLISNREFRKSYGLKADAQICFGDSGVTFQRSKLFNCIREILANSTARPTCKDAVGEEWLLELVENENERRVALSKGERRLFLPDFSAISPLQSERLQGFERVAEEVNLPKQAVSYWREILSSGTLEDDDLDLLNAEIKETPIRVAALIRSGLEAGKSSFTSLVPRSRRYFERLVGEYQQSISIADYAHTAASEHINQLMSWQPYDGFLLALLLSSHSLNSSVIRVEQLKEADLINAYEWLQKNGDWVSKVGAIEIGLSILDKHPEIEPYLKGIIEQIRDDKVDNDSSRFKLMSALIVLVEGELSRTMTLIEKPPFWRRLASIAHASLIERCIIDLGVDIAEFTKWAMPARGQLFYLQTMCDLRREPRWHTDYVSPFQLKAEFIGRIVSAAQSNASKLETSTLKDLLLGDGPQNLQTLLQFPYPYLPGPLEGGLESQNEPPDEVVKEIEERLSKEVLLPESFIALVNSALIFRIDSHHAEVAAKALRTAKHQIQQAADRELLSSILKGLATVAAITRSVELAAELRTLIRRCRHEPGRVISAEVALWIGLIAAAAHSELTDWCKFVGEWITELAFQPLQQDEMARLRSHIEQLCHIVPDLWCNCGRAEAALSAVKASIPDMDN